MLWQLPNNKYPALIRQMNTVSVHYRVEIIYLLTESTDFIDPFHLDIDHARCLNNFAFAGSFL